MSRLRSDIKRKNKELKNTRMDDLLEHHDYATRTPGYHPGSPSTSAVYPPEDVQPPSTRVSKVGRPSGTGHLSKVHQSLRCRRYATALRQLLEMKAGKTAFIKVCQEVIRKERNNLLRDKEGPYRTSLTPESLSSFCWEKTNALVEDKAPVTLMCLRSMFPQAKKIQGQHKVQNHGDEQQRRMTEAEAQQLVEKRIGMVMSVALFTCSNKVNFVQSVVGVEMWRQGCPVKMFTTMKSLGISQSSVAARGNLDRLQVDHDKELKLWKMEVEKEPSAPGYSLSWEHLKIADEHVEDGNQSPIWTFRFAHRNRIHFSHLQGPLMKAVEVAPASILPSTQTYESLRQRMQIIVMRIIVDNLTALEGLRSKVVRHIPHEYSQQMKEKSTVVNLGAVPENPSTIEAVITIMDGLIDYVPTVDGKPNKILCCADGLSIDRMWPSRQARMNGSSPASRFEGLVEAPPEFHRESVYYQDMMKLLFGEKSISSWGSLYHMKIWFSRNHLALLENVKDEFQHVWDFDFITFVVSAYVTLYAATECNLDTVDQKPSDIPTDAEAQMEWLSGLAQRLVDLVWMPPTQEDIKIAAAAANDGTGSSIAPYCSCGEEPPGETLLQCSSNLCGGVWYHEECAEVETPGLTPGFCSPECQANGTYIYCYCKEKREGQMVQCALMDKCKRHEWYHKDCLSLSEQSSAEQSTWYCSEACTMAPGADDHVLNYTKALVWEGLYNMARRDAVREGDGEAMTDFCKMDMVLFWARKHIKDFTICHRMLTGIEGFYPESVRQDLKWNRVANLQGTPGGNIGLDLVNEFMNDEFKDSLPRGSYTSEHVKCCSKMAGARGDEVDRLLTSPGTGRTLTTSLSSSSSFKRAIRADIAEFVVSFKEEHLFRYIPGRAHQGFENFTYQQKIQAPKKMGEMMRNLAEDMDDYEDLKD